MKPSTCPALLAALLALGACATSDDQRPTTDAGTTADTAVATTAATTATTGATATTTGAPDGTSGGTTHASHGETGIDASTAEPTTAEPTTGGEDLGCAAYCDTIAAHCTGENQQYGSLQTCLATCATFMPGQPEDTGGNTLGCRSYHAGAAADMPEIHCTHAGPGGGGPCGTNCEGFCSIAAVACPEAWPDDAACQTACATFPADEPYDATDVGGDTFACRLYHLTAAALDPVTHCSHIKGDSAPCQ